MKASHRKIITKALHLITQGWELLEEIREAEQYDFDSMTELDQKGSEGVDAEETIEALYSAVEALQSIENDVSYYELPVLPIRRIQIVEEV